MFTRLGKIKTAAQSYLNQYKNNDPATYAAAQQAIGGVLIVDGFIGIDNPFGSNKRSGIFGSLIGIVLGVVFLFMPTIFNKFTGVNEMTATTTATIVNVNRSSGGSDEGDSCTATARYTVSGKEYTQRSSYGSGGYCSLTEGSTVEINYNPNQPGAWGYDIDSLDTFMKIFQVVGAVTIIGSLVTFIIRLLSIYFGWKILKSGRALAKTLPAGTNFDTIKNEIRQNFSQQLFNFGGGNIQPLSQPGQVASVQGQPTQQPNTISPQVPQQPSIIPPPTVLPQQVATPTVPPQQNNSVQPTIPTSSVSPQPLNTPPQQPIPPANPEVPNPPSNDSANT